MREARNDTGGEGSGREGRNGRLAMVSAACAGLIVTAMLAVLGGKVEVNLPKK